MDQEIITVFEKLVQLVLNSLENREIDFMVCRRIFDFCCNLTNKQLGDVEKLRRLLILYPSVLLDKAVSEILSNSSQDILKIFQEVVADNPNRKNFFNENSGRWKYNQARKHFFMCKKTFYSNSRSES